MHNETIHKLVTMLDEARATETELRKDNVLLQIRNEDKAARIRELEKQIAEYETILKPIRPEDEDRLSPCFSTRTFES